MCIIFVADCKTDLQKLSLASAWVTNPDGAGIIALQGRKHPMIVRKGIMSLRALNEVLDALPVKLPIALHMRMATHGKPSIGNCHPFKVDDKQYLMHNGILDGLGKSGHNGQSDSAHLAKILGKLSYADRKGMLNALSGKYVLASPGKFTLYGHYTEEKGVSMSNTYWRGYTSTFNYVEDKRTYPATHTLTTISNINGHTWTKDENGKWSKHDTPTTNDADTETVNDVALRNLDDDYRGYC